MPYKTGKLKGELTSAEIRKLIRGHNKLVTMKIPTGLDRDGLIKFLKRNKYELDHKNQKIINQRPTRGRELTLERAKELTKRKPKPEEKQKTQRDKNRKRDADILRENGFTTLSEYRDNIDKLREGVILDDLPLKKRKEIKEYTEKVTKELKISNNVDTSKKLFANTVGNLERQFGFLANKIREGEVNVNDYKDKGLAKKIT